MSKNKVISGLHHHLSAPYLRVVILLIVLLNMVQVTPQNLSKKTIFNKILGFFYRMSLKTVHLIWPTSKPKTLQKLVFFDIYTKNVTPQRSHLYIYAVGGESWPPQGGDLVPSTLPAAEPSILARGKIGNLTCANRGVFRSQIPRVRGPNSLPSRFSQKRPSKQSPKKNTKPLFL